MPAPCLLTNPSPAAVLQLLLMVGFAAFVFMAGVIVGVQFFDVHRAGTVDDAKPWAGLTKANMKPPVGPDGREKANPLAKRAGHGKLRRASESSSNSDEQDAEAAAKPPSPPEYYASFDGRHPIEFTGAADATEVSFGAWIYLDSRDKTPTIKTIASNRLGGCKVDDDHRGYSFFVNNWETEDRSLILEWRNSAGGGSACSRLASEPATIPYDTWTHVGFAFQKPSSDSEGTGKAMLFLNGKLLRTADSVREPRDVMRGSDALSLWLGSTADRQFGFVGRMAQVFVSQGVVTPRQLAAAVALTDLAGWAQMASAGASRLLASIVLSRSALSPDVIMDELKLSSDVTSVQAHSGVYVTELTGKLAAAAVGGGGAPRQQPQQAERGQKRLTPDDAAAPAPARPAPVVAKEPVREAAAAAPAAASGAAPAGIKYLPNSPIEKIPAAIRRGRIPGTAPAGSFDFSAGGNQWVPRMIRVPAEQASGSVEDKAALAAGTFSDDVTLEQLAASDATGRERAAAVKGAMQHVWSNYKKHAWGRDELKPRSAQGQDNWAGVGMTLVDSLDTLFVMGMMDEFKEATEWVRTSLDFNKHMSISVFETTIRALGGLLAAYDLSKEKVFLDKAKDLGDRLAPAFDTPSGIPRASIVLATGQSSNPGWTGGSSILAELGTLQVSQPAIHLDVLKKMLLPPRWSGTV